MDPLCATYCFSLRGHEKEAESCPPEAHSQVGKGTPQRQVRGASAHIGQLEVRVAPGAETADSSGRCKGPIWETGKVNFRIQATNTHRKSLRGLAKRWLSPF